MRLHSHWGGAVFGRAKNLARRFVGRRHLQSEYTLTLVGDTSLGDYFMRRYMDGCAVQRRLREAPLSFFGQVRHLISGSSCLIANLETTLVSEIESPLNPHYPDEPLSCCSPWPIQI